MTNLTNDSFDFCFRWVSAARWLRGALTFVLTLGMLGLVSATSVSAVELVSINLDGTDSGNLFSEDQAISADGRFVVFQSLADDLVANDGNDDYDVFVRDLQSGTTTLVSLNAEGTGSGNGGSFSPVISDNGRFVAYRSYAEDLVAMDANNEGDVFVRDLESGTTILVSANIDGTNSGNAFSTNPVISASGRYVAFVSGADDLVATDTNGSRDVFVRDLESGSTFLVSINKDGTDSGNGDSEDPVISADGRYVAYQSLASDLATTDSNNDYDVLVHDLQSGATCLLSVNKDETDSGAGSSRNPVMSADGRFVAFTSEADDLVALDANGWSDVFVREVRSRITTLVSVNKDGTNAGNDASLSAEISADGGVVAFLSNADNLVAADTNGMGDVFVRDLQSGTTSLVSVNKEGADSGFGASFDHQISADGRFVAFTSNAGDLVAMDASEWESVFVRDLQDGTTRIISVNNDGTSPGNGWSYAPVISADGRFVAFVSIADNLVTTDTNDHEDVFVAEVFDVEPKVCDCSAPGAIKGTSNTDLLIGTHEADIICGFGDKDFIFGLDGDDCIDGGDGYDWIYGGAGDDKIFGGSGNDFVYAHGGNDEINGEEGKDYLFGGDGDDKLDGGEGIDWIFGGEGTDEGIGEYVRGCEN
jgi:Tol biopolymer transport system component